VEADKENYTITTVLQPPPLDLVWDNPCELVSEK